MRPPSAPTIIALAFAVVAASLALRFDLVDDEGYITYLGALTLRQTPLAGFFFQKFHPSLSVLYAAVSALGWRSFLVAHALFGAVGVYLAGSVAARLGGSGAVASAALALSPVYLLSAASGQSNSDGITLLLLALWLAGSGERRAPLFLAGLVLAAAVWARYEFALAAAVLGLHLTLDPRTRWAGAGLAAGPAVYLLAGAAYHHDALWWLHLPPTLPHLLPGRDPDALLPRNPAQVIVAAGQLSLVCAAWLLPFGLDPAGLPPGARRLRAAFLVTLAAMVLVPFLRVLNFEHSPRYLSAILPFAAVLAGVWSAAPGAPRPAAGAVAFALLLGTVAFAESLSPSLLVALLLPLAVWVPTRSARGLLVVLACVASAALAERRSPLLDGSRADAATLAAARWIGERGAGRALYTNDQHLALTLVARGRRPPPRYLVAFDIQLELLAMLDARNGQRDAVLRTLSPHLYGEAAWVCEFIRRPPPPGALFALTHEERILRYFPRPFWEARARLVATFGGVEVWERRGDARDFSPEIDRVLGMSRSTRDAPCDALGIRAAVGGAP